jgi:hypothetical protein
MRFLTLGLLVMPCAFPQKIVIEFDQSVDFSKFATFAIRDARLNSKSPSLNSEGVKSRINADIQKFFEKKGLKFVAEGESSVNVLYMLDSAVKSAVVGYPAGPSAKSRGVMRVPYTEGELVIDLHDPITRAVLWRATAREEKTEIGHIVAKLDDMVRKSIDEYPPKRK